MTYMTFLCATWRFHEYHVSGLTTRNAKQITLDMNVDESQVHSMPRMSLPRTMLLKFFTYSLHQMHPYQQFVTPIHSTLPSTPQPTLNPYAIPATHFPPSLCPQLVRPRAFTHTQQLRLRTWGKLEGAVANSWVLGNVGDGMMVCGAFCGAGANQTLHWFLGGKGLGI